MKIADVRTTTVAVPLQAPLRHALGAHWGRFVRTIVEVETELAVFDACLYIRVRRIDEHA